MCPCVGICPSLFVRIDVIKRVCICGEEGVRGSWGK